uniref:Retrovirus-related Pol polyprotein from transposon TNT 1-94 n=1 Tax=Tanacetum cinerariifolium TaxID=118510 RepID=A0A6L2JXR8_TANCI|nr:hypothetical protein [Tanacetum cinerariifolium]
MVEEQAIVYAPQCGDMTVEKSLGVLQLHISPPPPSDDFVAWPLKEYLIKFSVMNDQKRLTLDYETFCSSTGHDYNKGKYVAYPSLEAVKVELTKIVTNASYLGKTLVLNNSFPMAWIIRFTFIIQVIGENYSSTEQINYIQHIRAYCLITGTEVDIEEIIYSDLVTKLLSKSRLKYVSYLRFNSFDLEVLLGSEYNQDKQVRSLPNILSNFNFLKDPSKVTEIKLKSPMIVVNNQKDSVSPLLVFRNKKKVKSKTMTPTLPKSQGPEASRSTGLRYRSLTKNKGKTSSKVNSDTKTLQLNTFAEIQAFLLFEDEMAQESDDEDVFDSQTQENDHILPLTERQLVKYLKKVSRVLFIRILKNSGNNMKKLMSFMLTSRRQLKDAVKEYHVLNKKVIEATKAYTKNSTHLTKLPTLIKNFNFQGLKSSVESLHATALSQDKHLAKWAKSPTFMASNLVLRMTAIENSQVEITINVLQTTLAIIGGTSNVKGENVTPIVTEEPPSHTEGETKDMETQDTNEDKVEKEQVSEEPTRVVPISTVRPITRPNPEVALIESSSRRPLTNPILEIYDPNEPMVPYMINGKMHYLTNEEINAHLKKEDKIKKAAKEAKRFEITKTEVIKIVQEEAKKIEIDPKKVISAKAGEKFKKAQDAEMKVHKR